MQKKLKSTDGKRDFRFVLEFRDFIIYLLCFGSRRERVKI